MIKQHGSIHTSTLYCETPLNLLSPGPPLLFLFSTIKSPAYSEKAKSALRHSFVLKSEPLANDSMAETPPQSSINTFKAGVKPVVSKCMVYGSDGSDESINGTDSLSFVLPNSFILFGRCTAFVIFPLSLSCEHWSHWLMALNTTNSIPSPQMAHDGLALFSFSFSLQSEMLSYPAQAKTVVWPCFSASFPLTIQQQ